MCSCPPPEFGNTDIDNEQYRYYHNLMAKTINSKLPAATLGQRLAAMSTAELMFAARELAQRTEAGSDAACTAVLDQLESRVAGPSFDMFVAEIYS